MASVSKIAANQRNASRSTGPRSHRGKSHTRGNATRHGLAARVVFDPESATCVRALAAQIVDGSGGFLTYEAACDIAQAELDLVRIRELKVTLIQEALMQQRDAMFGTGPTAVSAKDQGDLAAAVGLALPQLVKLDRYERRAAARRDRGVCSVVMQSLVS
jgi:hypothetical protein